MVTDFVQLLFLQFIINIILLWFVLTSPQLMFTKMEYALLFIHFIVNSIFIVSLICKWNDWIHIIHYFLPIYLILCLVYFRSKFLLWLLLACFVIILILFHIHGNQCIISRITNKTLCLKTFVVKYGLLFMIMLVLLKIKNENEKFDFS